MSPAIDTFHMHVDDLPGIWSPVQWELEPSERVEEIENQARASLLWAVDAPEAALRMFLSEVDVERALKPPTGYDPEKQGEWNEDLVTFSFKRAIKLIGSDRQSNQLSVEYDFGDLGYWSVDIEPEKITIERI